MKKWVIFLLLPLLALILQSTLLNYIPSGRFKPNIILMIVIYMGLFQPSLMGASVVFFAGFLTDIFSGSIFGTNIFLNLLVYSVSSLFSEKFYLLGIPLGMFFVFLLSAFHSSALIVILYMAGRISFINEGIILTLISQSILTALISPVIFLLFNKVVEA